VSPAAPTISVVIIAYCEAEAIERAVRAAFAVGDEVVVVDGTSPDATADRARRAGARVLQVPRGRGRQCHAGALAARGRTLVFLHADAELAPGARRAIERVLSDPELDAGNFRLRFEPASFWARLFGWANDVRRRRLGIYYGDSALFIRRAVYFELGGFRDDLPLMEDYEFVRRLEAAGDTAYVRDVVVSASARRFASRPVQTLALWVAVQVFYTLGVSPERLARWYASSSSRAGER